MEMNLGTSNCSNSGTKFEEVWRESFGAKSGRQILTTTRTGPQKFFRDQVDVVKLKNFGNSNN